VSCTQVTCRKQRILTGISTDVRQALRFCVCLTAIRRGQRPRMGTRSYTSQFDCQFTAFSGLLSH
jgi:hypothetical protein